MKGYLYQINISNGGVPKTPVFEAIVDFEGIIGDKQRDKRYHGGSERALCLFSFEEIEKLQQEGHPIKAGSTGENLTISIPEYQHLQPGVLLKIGSEVVIQISSYTVPCKTISASFTEGNFIRISQKINPGSSRLYARILIPGRIKANDEIILMPKVD